jgi:hypothetical protein
MFSQFMEGGSLELILDELPIKLGEQKQESRKLKNKLMSIILVRSSLKVRCKHPSTSLRVTVRLSEVEVCFAT